MRFLATILVVALVSLPPIRAAGETPWPSAALDAAVADGTFQQITSVVVAQNGEILLERYWGDFNAASLHDTRSATKSLTAMAIGAAIADGAINSVEQPITQFFEAERPYRFSSPLKDAITVRDLLTMSSAFDCNDNEWSSPGNEEHMYPARRWRFFVLDLPTKDSYARDTQGYGPFSYCTAGSFLLGQIIEEATGEKVSTYIERRLLEPLRISEVTWGYSPSGETQTGGGTRLSSRSLLKLAELVRRSGKSGDQALLSANWINEMTRKHVVASAEQDYGYQWWRRDFACGDDTISGWYMSGNGGNKVVVFRELGISVVVTATLYGTSGMHQQSTRLIEEHVLPHAAGCAKS